MSTLKNFIRENFVDDDDTVINIPWSLHESITLEDIAFVSMRAYLFSIDDEYHIHISSERSPPNIEFLRISERFTNYENTCFLFAILQDGWRDNICGLVSAEDPEPGLIFSREYYDEALKYGTSHGLAHRLFGTTLAKIGYIQDEDDKWFMSKYLGKLGGKK